MPANVPVIALIDTLLLAKQLRAMDIAVGEWINVIGYISELGASDLLDSPSGTAAVKPEATSTGYGKSEARNVEAEREVAVHVQALLLWSAGAVDINEYETAVDRFRSAVKSTEASVESKQSGGVS